MVDSICSMSWSTTTYQYLPRETLEVFKTFSVLFMLSEISHNTILNRLGIIKVKDYRCSHIFGSLDKASFYLVTARVFYVPSR